jgi:hypothetical protein
MPATVIAAGAAVVQVEWHGGVQVDVVAVGGRSVSEEGLEACGSEEDSPLAAGPASVGFGPGSEKERNFSATGGVS